MCAISETELHPEPHFLGLDASTQALKASLLSANLDVLHEAAVNFDADLPQLGTKGGVLRGPEGSGEVYAPVEVLGLAMDLLMERIKAKGWTMSAVRGVAAAGQQHASVYWSQQSASILSSIVSSKALAPQLEGAYSRNTIPNWQDSSTTSECRTLDAAFGGSAGLARATGSKAHERFTGAQIMRFKSIDPEAYAQTDRISLVSSAITTLLCLDGQVKGIDESDACGMNLWTMDRKERGWSDKVLQVIVGGKQEDKEELARKLGKVETDGGWVVGMIGRWYVERYGFHPECCVFPGTGDNPATFLSLTLRPNEGLVSLGTSDVVLVSTSTYNPHPEYHAFFHPAQIAPPSTQDAGEKRENTSLRYFNMLVYKNGSLAREHVRDVYFDKSWDKFNAAVEQRRSTSGDDVPGDTAFWWLLPDIIPDNASGVHKYTTSPSGASDKVSEYPDPSTNAIAILSSQLLNYRARSSAILDSRPVTVRSGSGSTVERVPPTPMSPYAPRLNSGTNGYFHETHTLPSLSRVYATGGASANKTITSLMADILDAPVSKNVEYDVESGKWVDAHWNACSVGVAYKARWGYERYLASLAHTGVANGSAKGSANGARDSSGTLGVSDASRQWVDFDTVVQECRDRRAALGKRLGRGNKMSDGTELQEEGIRNVAVPGPGKEAWEGRVGWWAQLEARALRGE